MIRGFTGVGYPLRQGNPAGCMLSPNRRPPRRRYCLGARWAFLRGDSARPGVIQPVEAAILAFMDTLPGPHFTTAQAAIHLLVSKETVGEYLRRGWLRGQKIGRGWRVEAESVIRLLRCGPPAH
jgi:excisionase family DNA binding protein